MDSAYLCDPKAGTSIRLKLLMRETSEYTSPKDRIVSWLGPHIDHSTAGMVAL